jgi:hypothetical protein
VEHHDRLDDGDDQRIGDDRVMMLKELVAQVLPGGIVVSPSREEVMRVINSLRRTKPAVEAPSQFAATPIEIIFRGEDPEHLFAVGDEAAFDIRMGAIVITGGIVSSRGGATTPSWWMPGVHETIAHGRRCALKRLVVMSFEKLRDARLDDGGHFGAWTSYVLAGTSTLVSTPANGEAA